jgi:hypothetical protein
MVADTFSVEKLFFSKFLDHSFFLGAASKKCKSNRPDAAKKRVKKTHILWV